MAIDNYTLGEHTGLGGRALARSMGTPIPGGTKTLATSVGNASTTVSPGHYMLVAETTGCFVRLGVGSATAVVDQDLFVPANVPMMIFVGLDDTNVQYTHIAAILRAGTGYLHITPMKA